MCSLSFFLCRRGSEVTHVKIQSTEEYFDLYGGEKFATLAELVEHYTDSQNSLRETSGQIITLKVPLYVEEVTNERCVSLNYECMLVCMLHACSGTSL